MSFKTFCCCLGLETGAKVIGYLHLLVSLCLTVLCSVYAIKLYELVGTVEDADDHLYTIWYKLMIISSCISTGHVLLAALLLFGVYKRNPTALRVWVWLMWLLFFVAVGGNMIVEDIFGSASYGNENLLAIFEWILFFGTVAYCILCVNSYHLMVKRCEDLEGPVGTD